MLVQYGIRSRPTDWSQVPAQIPRQGQAPVAGMEIRSVGRAPWLVESARLEVAIRNPGLSRATVLDMNGMPAGALPLERSSTQVAFRFPGAAMYVLLR